MVVGRELGNTLYSDSIGIILHYLEGQGDLVSRLVTPISHITTPIIPIISLLTKSP